MGDLDYRGAGLAMGDDRPRRVARRPDAGNRRVSAFAGGRFAAPPELQRPRQTCTASPNGHSTAVIKIRLGVDFWKSRCSSAPQRSRAPHCSASQAVIGATWPFGQRRIGGCRQRRLCATATLGREQRIETGIRVDGRRAACIRPPVSAVGP